MDNRKVRGSEREEKKRKTRWIIVALIAIVWGILLALLVLWGAFKSDKVKTSEERNTTITVAPTATPTATPTPMLTPTPSPTPSPSPTPTPLPTPTVVVEESSMDSYLAQQLESVAKKEMLEELLGTSYDEIYPMSEKSMSCIVKKDGKWGVVSVTGEVLVPLQFERYSILDRTGWVEFEQDGQFYVYDEQGNFMVHCQDKTMYRMKSEDEHLYRTAKAYMSTMEIKTIIPEIRGEDYYGVEYRSLKTGELLYSAVGTYEEAGMFTYPDETGRAIAIRGDGTTSTIYYITADGCESREMELPARVLSRKFDFVGNYEWADCSLSHGWVKVYVSDVETFLFSKRTHNYLAFLNVDTLELVPFPEEYQTHITVKNACYGNAMAIRKNSEQEESEKVAICKGDKVFTEEKYDKVMFGEKCIAASHELGVDILDYEGTVIDTFRSCSGVFVNGKMLVLEEDGLYFINENFERCSEALLSGWKVDGCFTRGIIVDGKYYFLKEFAQPESEEMIAAVTPKEAVVPQPTEVPVKMMEETCELVEIGVDVCRYLEEIYIIMNGDCYGMADLNGNILVEPDYNELVYYDGDWVCFENAEKKTHVYDHQGNLLYEYVCEAEPGTLEDGTVFYREICYRQGMKIMFDYNEAEEYYGIHYYNAESDELIFELTTRTSILEGNPYANLQVASMPDETGTAVVIAGDGCSNAIYKITRDGYTEETYTEPFVERRYFRYSLHDVWNRANLVDGWLITTIVEHRGELLDYSKERSNILYNIHTKERITMPEAYQDWCGEVYRNSAGIYYGISGESFDAYKNGVTDNVYYAVCRGNEMLTEELYQWIDFGEKYIIAGNNSFSHILDYEGKVLAEYLDVAFPFADGKTLVCDEKGAFYIDEELQRCSDYVLEDVDYCYPDFIRKGDSFYLIRQTKTEE